MEKNLVILWKGIFHSGSWSLVLATAGPHRSQVVACRGKQLQMDVKGHLSTSQLTSEISQHWSERKGKSAQEKTHSFFNYLPLAYFGRFINTAFTV